MRAQREAKLADGKATTVVLTVADVRAIVHRVGLHALMDQVIETLEQTCLDFPTRGYKLPPRDGIRQSHGLLEWMPVLEPGGVATIKIVGYHPANPRERHLPTILSTALTFDAASGRLLGICDATFTTALRTGAASAVATRVLAADGAQVLGLIGAGAQALAQLHALSRVLSLKTVCVYDVDPLVAASFAARAARLQVDVDRIAVLPVDQLVRAADVLCTATSTPVAAAPVFADEGLKPHVHVNAIGSDLPGKLELPLGLLKRSLVAVDFLPQALAEGEAQQLERHEIGPDLVALVQGAAQFGAHRSGPSVFDSTGFALEDHAVVQVLHEHARALQLGTYCEIECVAADPHDPYAFLGPDAHVDEHVDERVDANVDADIGGDG